MKIRLMTIKDFSQMYLLWKKVGLPIQNIRIEKKIVKQMISLNPASSFVAEEGKEIVGTIFGTFNGRRGWIYHLAVDPSFQHQGLGSLFLKKVEQALKRRGAERVLLPVDTSNLKVIKFYKKSGYKQVDDAIFMGKNL